MTLTEVIKTGAKRIRREGWLEGVDWDISDGKIDFTYYPVYLSKVVFIDDLLGTDWVAA